MFERYQLTQVIMLVLISVFLATSPGCGGDDAEPDQETTQPASPNQNAVNTEPTPSGLLIEQATSLWDRGQKDQAADMLLNVDFSTPVRFSPGSLALSLTEKEFDAMNKTEQLKVQTEIHSIVTLYRDLTKHLIAWGQAALFQQDYQDAEKCQMTVYHFGQVFTGDPESEAVFRLSGFVIAISGLTELIELYTQTNNQQQLVWAQNERQTLDAERKKYIAFIKSKMPTIKKLL